MKVVSIRELNEMLSAQEEEIRAEYVDRHKVLMAENERLSILLGEKFKLIDELTERLEKLKGQVKDSRPAPIIVGVMDCGLSPCMGDPEPENIISKFDIPCLGDDDACVSCGS